MTSSLGVEVTPGRFRSLGDLCPLPRRSPRRRPARLPGVGRRPARCAPRRPGRDPRPARRGPAAGGRPRAGRAAGPCAEVSRRVTDALRRGGAQRSFLAEDGGSDADPDRASRKTRTLQAAVHLAEDLHRFETRGDGEVAWVDGTRRNVRLRLSPIDVGPVLSTMLWGEVTSVLTSATIPPRIVERVGLQAFPTEELNVGSPFDYRSPRAALRRPPPARPPGRRGRGGPARGALAAAGGRRRPYPGALHEQAGHRGGGGAHWRPSSPTRCSCRAICRRTCCSRSSPPTRPPACSPPWASGRAWTSPAGLSLVTIDKLPFPRPDDPLLQARRDRAGGRRLLAGRPAAGGHAAGPGLGPAHPQRRGPRRGGGARPPAGDGVVPRRPAGDVAAHAALGGHPRGGVVPAAGAGGRDRVGPLRACSGRERATPGLRPATTEPGAEWQLAQYPRRLSISSRFCQWRSTLTWRSR